jgi:LacI family transcriptional regulator
MAIADSVTDQGAGDRGRTRLTQRDLARHAGVSTATVSLVLRKSPLVAEETRLRVLHSAAALGYIYNRGAASLRTQQTHTVGLAINELTNPYFAELTAAIEHAFTRLGRTVFLSNSSESPARQERFVETMREYNADGLIICPAEGTDPVWLQRLAAIVPCVLISRRVVGADVDYAGNDHRVGTHLATEHLLALGHRRIAMLGGTERISTGAERHQGYRDALAAYGVAADPALVRQGVPTRENGVRWIQELLAAGTSGPTAAVCFNDVVAFGVMLGLRQIGREPGRDFSVVGCDDIAEAALWRPALSTVAIRSTAIGDAAAALLLDRIADVDRPARQVVLQPELVLRETSGPLPIQAPVRRRRRA